MNVLGAMEETMKLASAKWRDRPNLDNEPEYRHLQIMQHSMRYEKMSYGKLNRWLGWMQHAIVSWNCGVTLEDMKEINKRHKNDDPERRLLLVLAEAVLNDDPFVTAGLRARIQRLMGDINAS